MAFLFYIKFVFIINGGLENIYTFSILEGLYLVSIIFPMLNVMCNNESQNQEEGIFLFY